MSKDLVKESKIEYTYRGKKYAGIPELSPNSCVGCAFASQLDCYKHEDRISLCRDLKVIFARKLNIDK